jgi:5-methyltetrahydrofolate--homocysteine methyltransferase
MGRERLDQRGLGERTNVTGSARFRKLITAGDYTAALEVAREQVRTARRSSTSTWTRACSTPRRRWSTFLNLIAAEPDIARVPMMIDSSKWSVIEAGLKCVQGKPIVNSISMKEGEEKFLASSPQGARYGAAVVVMAFDETGPGRHHERKVEICTRAYKLLTEEGRLPARGHHLRSEHLRGGDRHRGAQQLRRRLHRGDARDPEACPICHISGGVSNLSFSFRGNEPVREAMHAVFLYHAIQAGMDMGIVNAGQLAVYDQIDPELREACEDVILNRRPDATERLLELAERYKGGAGQEAKART